MGYGLIAARYRPHPLVGAAALGVGVWAAAYAQLVPLGIYEPPWRYPIRTIALDVSYHLVYGSAVSGAHRALDGSR